MALRGISRSSQILGLVAALALSGTSARAQQPVTLLGYSATTPAGWQFRKPSSNMRLAEFVIPGAAGTVDAEMVVYFFGPGQGGSADANIERWRSQFSNTPGTVFEQITTDTINKLPVTFAEFRGTYARGIGAGADAGEGRPNHTLIAAIVETPKGTLFFQLFGPSPAIVSAKKSFEQMLRSMKE